VARGDPVDGIGVVRDADAAGSFKLLPKSYRPGTADRRGRGHLGELLRERLRAHHGGLPERRPRGVVEGDEDLAAVAVEDREALPRCPRGADPGAERIERRDAARRLAEAERQPFGGGDADPQAGERPRPEPDRDQVDRLPAARLGGAALDLGQEAGRVQRPAAVAQAQQRLGDDLAVAPGAGGGVGGRGVEADDDQGARLLPPTSRERRRSRLSSL
jgi:hypothetical protein